MSQDYGVYGLRQSPPTAEDLLAELRARGIGVDWKPSQWGEPLTGELVVTGQTNPSSQLLLSTRLLTYRDRQRLIKAYDAVLTEQTRRRLESAAIAHALSVSGGI